MSIGPDTPIPVSRCTCCGHKLDMAMAVGAARPPKRGDFTICIRCGTILVFGKKLRLREPRGKEFHDIAGDSDLIAAQKLLKIVTEEEKKRETTH